MRNGYRVLGSNNGLTIGENLADEKVMVLLETDEISEGTIWLSDSHAKELTSVLRKLVNYNKKPIKKIYEMLRSVPLFINIDEDDNSLEIKLKRKSKSQLKLSEDEVIEVIKRIESLKPIAA